MTRKTWLTLFLIVTAVAIVAIHQWDRDARRIHKRLDQLTGIITKHPDDGHLVTLAKSQQVVNLFTPEATVHLQPVWSHQMTRRELSSIFYQVHSRVDSLDVRIRDTRLEVNRRAGVADMRFTAMGTAKAGGHTQTDTHEFRLRWVKVDREWYVERAEIVQGIRPPRDAP